MTPRRRRSTTITSVITALCLAIGAALVGTPAFADTAPSDPSSPSSPVTVAADSLPTVQINGVAWSQVVVGTTVYVAGSFTNARPAGAAAGTNTTTRNNLLAYNIETGNLITSFAPSLNAQALSITKSPDGSRIYVVGDFTTVDGNPYYRIAAFSTATGAVIPSFKPVLSTQARSVAATNSTVYIGGAFKSVNSQTRNYLAAVNASNGAVTSFNPNPDATVDSLAVAPDGSKLYAGGRFTTLAGAARRGLGAVNASTGASLPFAANNVVRNAGTQSSITSLYATTDRVYGTGYVYATDRTVQSGNLEGTFSADPNGNLVWIEDCHGDSYSVFPQGNAVYVAAHKHYCGNIGAFPQTNPWTYSYATAFSKAATGTITADPLGYYNFEGNPSPTLLNWFPKLVSGTYTGQGQAGWSVTGNDRYVVYGGEFPLVNDVGQQGLARFAVSSVAPNKVAPVTNAELVPNVTSYKSGQVRISWTATFDRDNANLTYKLVRDGVTASPIYSKTQASNFYTRPQMGFVDTGLTPGSTHTYRLYVTDPFGNQISRLAPTATVASSTTTNSYSSAIESSSASSYWPLDESSGTVGYDHNGFVDLQVKAGVTRGETGIVSNQSATKFSGGSTGFAATPTSIKGPDTFSAEAWIKTTTTSGGKIIGFGDSNTGDSSLTDRHVYMDGAGRVWFGLYPGGVRTVNSSASYNDGAWHHIVATLGSGGMSLYVDGARVASRTDVTSGRNTSGYWRIGGDSLRSWTSRPSSDYFSGTIAQAAVYPSALSASVIQSHYSLGTGGASSNDAPTAAFTSSVNNLTASFSGSGSSDSDGTIASYAWDYGDGSTGTGQSSNHTYSSAGTYTVELTVEDNDGSSDSVTHNVTVTAAPASNQAPNASFTASSTGLAASFSGAGSTDSDGTIASYAWNYGDNTTGTGVSSTHTYAAAGTYSVVLTVTDDDGATDTATQQVTVSSTPTTGALAQDDFARTVASGWGSAPTGGAWTITGSATALSVGDGVGKTTLPGGSTRTAVLSGVSTANSDSQVSFSLDTVPTGTGSYARIFARQSASGNYSADAWMKPTGVVALVIKQGSTVLSTTTVSGLTYTAGTVLNLRVQVSGSSPTTIRGRIWAASATEPTTWLSTVTDSTAALQSAGSPGLQAATSSSATASVLTRFDNFVVRAL